MFRKLYVLASLILGLNLGAQISISVDSIVKVSADTLNYGDTLIYNVRIKNDGNMFSGPVTVYLGVLDSSGSVVIVDTTGTNVTNWNTNSTLWMWLYGYTVDTMNFMTGVNTVVIWPKANYSPTNSDTDTVSVFVLTQNFIGEKSGRRGFMMYPNPARDEIFIAPLTANHPYRKILIYDVKGVLIRETDFALRTDIRGLEKGIYILKLLHSDGNFSSVRFVRD